METTRLQEAGCHHLLWLRGNGVARADRPLHGPPWHARRNGSALGSAGPVRSCQPPAGALERHLCALPAGFQMRHPASQVIPAAASSTAVAHAHATPNVLMILTMPGGGVGG
jgi:hypothetical protein